MKKKHDPRPSKSSRCLPNALHFALIFYLCVFCFIFFLPSLFAAPFCLLVFALLLVRFWVAAFELHCSRECCHILHAQHDEAARSQRGECGESKSKLRMRMRTNG